MQDGPGQHRLPPNKCQPARMASLRPIHPAPPEAPSLNVKAPTLTLTLTLNVEGASRCSWRAPP
eukprot:scaffold101852_cov42-Phaeocystis_antarctica.AAC.1